MTGGARVAAAEGGGRRSGLAVGRCWANSVSGLRARLNGAADGLERRWAALAVEEGDGLPLRCWAETGGLKGENGEWREKEKGFFFFLFLKRSNN
jgi:hypothetical protein